MMIEVEGPESEGSKFQRDYALDRKGKLDIGQYRHKPGACGVQSVIWPPILLYRSLQNGTSRPYAHIQINIWFPLPIFVVVYLHCLLG